MMGRLKYVRYLINSFLNKNIWTLQWFIVYEMIYPVWTLNFIHQNPSNHRYHTSIPPVLFLFLKILWLVNINTNWEFRRFSSLHKIFLEGKHQTHTVWLYAVPLYLVIKTKIKTCTSGKFASYHLNCCSKLFAVLKELAECNQNNILGFLMRRIYKVFEMLLWGNVSEVEN